MTQVTTKQVTTKKEKPVKLVKHYDLFYWWVVWLYAALAWVASGANGKSIVVTDKPLQFSENPMLGIGFVAAFLFVAIFTSIRARGSMSMVFVCVILIAGWVMHHWGAWQHLMDQFPNLRVHMNQAFYGLVFAILFPSWVLATFLFNRFHYYTFEHGKQIGDMELIGGGSKTFTAQSVSIEKLPDDIFVHRLLGLWWLGLGTGDIVLTYTGPGGMTHKEIVENVWRVNRKIKDINQRIL